MLAADLNRDKKVEYVFIVTREHFDQAHLLRMDENNVTRWDYIAVHGRVGSIKGELEKGQLKVLDGEWQDIMIGEMRIRVNR